MPINKVKLKAEQIYKAMDCRNAEADKGWLIAGLFCSITDKIITKRN